MSFLISQALAQSTPPAPGGAAVTTATTQMPSQAGAPQGAPAQPGPLGMLMPFALMFGVIYFLIIRPQQKKLKEHTESLSTIKHGDEIITNAGIFGKITGITDKVLTVEIAEGVRVKMLKSQVATINPDLSSPKSLEAGTSGR